MKVLYINNKRKFVKQNKIISNSSSNNEKEIEDEDDLVIPNVSKNDPMYKKTCENLKRYKKTNPSLYNSIMYWD